MVSAAVLGHGALAVHQEAVPAALLGQRRLVSLGDEGVQLGLLAADGLHELMRERGETSEVQQRPQTIVWTEVTAGPLRFCSLTFSPPRGMENVIEDLKDPPMSFICPTVTDAGVCVN